MKLFKTFDSFVNESNTLNEGIPFVGKTASDLYDAIKKSKRPSVKIGPYWYDINLAELDDDIKKSGGKFPAIIGYSRDGSPESLQVNQIKFINESLNEQTVDYSDLSTDQQDWIESNIDGADDGQYEINRDVLYLYDGAGNIIKGKNWKISKLLKHLVYLSIYSIYNIS